MGPKGAGGLVMMALSHADILPRSSRPWHFAAPQADNDNRKTARPSDRSTLFTLPTAVRNAAQWAASPRADARHQQALLRRAFEERRLSLNEKIADAAVHAIGIAGARSGAVRIAEMMGTTGRPAEVAALSIYCGGLLAMLTASAAYNLVEAPGLRQLLRRFDHTGIFAMMAGTFTPFTVLALDGNWAIAATALVWSIALGGGMVVLVSPAFFARFAVPAYLGFGTTGLLIVCPLLNRLDHTTLGLLTGGLVLYVGGIGFHLSRRLPFRTAIWHVFVVSGAAVHYLAISTGILAASTQLLAAA